MHACSGSGDTRPRSRSSESAFVRRVRRGNVRWRLTAIVAVTVWTLSARWVLSWTPRDPVWVVYLGAGVVGVGMSHDGHEWVGGGLHRTASLGWFWLPFFHHRSGSNTWFHVPLWPVVAGVVVVWYRTSRSARRLRGLAGRPLCAGCGYDLGGLSAVPGEPAPRCPECGAISHEERSRQRRTASGSRP